MSGRAFSRLLALLVIAAHSIALARLVRSARQRLRDTSLATSEARPPDERVVAIVPVLNEQSRLAPCLEGLIDQPSLVSAIVVVDTGSSDRTAQLVAAYQMRDSRVRWLSAGSPPVGWNGKVWGLVQACQAFPANWYLIIDADVRPAPTLAERMLALAVRHGVTCGSVALQQRPMPDIGSWLLHPAFLTTLVYRYGVPGRLFSEPDDALVNGQAMLLHHRAVEALDDLRSLAHSNAEDVAAARRLLQLGHRVAFWDALDDSYVTMYRDGRAIWRAWPRSLPANEERAPWRNLLDAALLAGTQGAWLPLLLASRVEPSLRPAAILAFGVRLGMAWGIRRAYPRRPIWYWLSPLADPLVVVRLLMSSWDRRPTWRGRPIGKDVQHARESLGVGSL
jgi:dolichol-phosphate mannosyltransferase